MREIKFRFFDAYHRCMVNEGGSANLDTSDIIDQARRQNYPLMQYTGILDKNGVKIFEGDIVHLYGYGNYLCEFPFLELYEAAIELDVNIVLGNIHQNPELLEN